MRGQPLVQPEPAIASIKEQKSKPLASERLSAYLAESLSFLSGSKASGDIFLPSVTSAEYDVALQFPIKVSVKINLVLSAKPEGGL
jgi:hypothetical protein